MLAGEGCPPGTNWGKGDGVGWGMLCMGERIGWLQFIGEAMGCIPGDLILASPGDDTECVAGDRSGPGAGLLIGPGLVLGKLWLLCTDAGLRT